MKLSFKAVTLLTASLLLTSCTQPTRMASPEQKQTIENEFWTYLEETITNTHTEPTRFIYGGGSPYDLNRVQTRAFNPISPCDHDTDGAGLFYLHVRLSATEQDRTEEEEKAKIQNMSQIWETQGHQVQKVGPITNAQRIMFTTEAGVSVHYTVSKYHESVEVYSACVLPDSTPTPTPTHS